MGSGMVNPFSFSRSNALARTLNSVAGFAPGGNLYTSIFWNSANRPAAPGVSKRSINAVQVSLAVDFSIMDIEDSICMLSCPLALMSDCTHSFQSSLGLEVSWNPWIAAFTILPSLSVTVEKVTLGQESQGCGQRRCGKRRLTYRLC